MVPRKTETGQPLPLKEVRENEIKKFRPYSELFRNIHFFQCKIQDKDWVLFTIRADSFVLHQIRKMMFAVLAVIHEQLEKEFIDISLHSPFRFRLEMVPGSFLTLVDASFREKSLAEAGLESQALCKLTSRFREKVLMPHIQTLKLNNDFWTEFEETLSQFKIEDWDWIVERYRKWKKEMELKKKGIPSLDENENENENENY